MGEAAKRLSDTFRSSRPEIPWKQMAGMRDVYLGSATRRWSHQRLTQALNGGLEEQFDRFGSSLAAGDFDGNGKSDLAAGTPQENLAGISNAGAVYLYRGFSNGLIR
jgi:hypothetical protein